VDFRKTATIKIIKMMAIEIAEIIIIGILMKIK
jgi:hypothetical protein